MATPIEIWSKVEVRGAVRFLHAWGKNPTEIHVQIAKTYGEDAMSKRQVYRWCSLFQEGRTSLEDEVRSGRPSIQETNASQVDLLIQSDRRLKVREIADKLDLSKDTVHWIVHDMLGYRKVSARWMPKMLSDEHKEQRVTISQTLLDRYSNGVQVHGLTAAGDGQDNQENAFFNTLIISDETRINHTTPESKRQSMTWK